ncbi:hypothetical protein BX600DRAFT_530279 [Xylariales sp. PMI_506]|nr:hypothetical protein BX600DRAFT_530279 [Xylariales sp. PMI_506]
MSFKHYNEFQTFYCLSLAANVAGASSGTEADLQDALDEGLRRYLPELAGSWEVTWGPRVLKTNPLWPLGGPLNAWYAAVDQQTRTCVVAIAGTAIHSLEAWNNLNFAVDKVVDWNQWTQTWSPIEGLAKPTSASSSNPFMPFVSLGTATGVYNLLHTPSNLASDGMRLDQYLDTLPPGFTVVFAGHSLGGALAPTAAMALKSAGRLEGFESFTLPSAGVSPGNDNFAQMFSDVFPPTPHGPDYLVFNTDYYNNYDLVPQAWSLNTSANRNLLNITAKIYTNIGPNMQEVIANLMKWGIDKVEASGMAYAPLEGTGFTGPPISPVNTCNDLLAQIGSQHAAAYWHEMGISAFAEMFSKKVEAHPGVQATPVASNVDRSQG